MNLESPLKGMAKTYGQQLGQCFDRDGSITLKFKVRLHAIEFILIATKAAREGISMDNVIEDFLFGFPKGIGGVFLDYLQDYPPEKTADEKQEETHHGL